MTLSHDIPTHLAAPDRPLLGLTTPQVVILVGGIVSGIGALRQPHLPLVPRLLEGAVVLALTTAVALLRPHGRSLLTWGRLILAHRTGPRAVPWTAHLPAPTVRAGEEPPLPRPPHLARTRLTALTPVATERPTPVTPRHPSRQPVRPASSVVPATIVEGVVTFADGHSCTVLECSGPPADLMDQDALTVLHAQYHAVLVGLQVPLQIVLTATPVDLRRYSAQRQARLPALPLGLRRLESSDLAYMQRAARRLGVVTQRLVVVIPAPPAEGRPPAPPARPWVERRSTRQERTPVPDVARDAASARLLDERCDHVMAALRSAGVHARRLDTDALRALWYHRLCPRLALVQPLDPAHGALAVTRAITLPDDSALQEYAPQGGSDV